MIENREVQKGAFIVVGMNNVYQVEEVHVIIEDRFLKVLAKVTGMDLASYHIQIDSNTRVGNVGRSMLEYIQAGDNYAEAYRKSCPLAGIVHPGALSSISRTHTVHLINTECFSEEASNA